MHDNETLFPDPFSFRPARFLDARPDLQAWIPFGGGARRCLGAAFANMEMHVVLRTMLRSFTLEPTTEPNERWRSRGIASAPAKGGVAVVRRRPPRPGSPGEASVTEVPVTERTPVPRGTRVAGQPVVITSAASGIGRALAQPA